MERKKLKDYMEIETNNEKEAETETLLLPMVPLKGLVVFPGADVHFDVGRPQSIEALKFAMLDTQEVFLVAQKDLLDEEPERDGLYDTGVIAVVTQVLDIPKSNIVRAVVRVMNRGRLLEFNRREPYCTALVERRMSYRVPDSKRNEEEALVRKIKLLYGETVCELPRIPENAALKVVSQERAGPLADYIAGSIITETAPRQRLLDEFNTLKRAEKLCVMLADEVEIMRLQNDIEDRVQDSMDEYRREYYIREQIKELNEELYGDEFGGEIAEFRAAIEKLGLSEEASKKLFSECDRLERAGMSQSPESAVIRGYIEACLALPWNSETTDKLNLKRARRILDEDHYGLEKIKERIVEALAVRRLSPKVTGQILCFVGPPGVGKTSVARSVARAMGRKYVRISLGGIHDEAEIRGHRKTYIGSMPGRIMNALKLAGTRNPVMLLDEVDKLGSDYRGDPASALLEVLDGEQNFSFRDHYIELPFDLSRVFFITTANDRSLIPPPLLDRMEIIELSSYTGEEKLNIARRHLLPKQAKRHGLNLRQLRISDDALRLIIDGYTREAGVRQLEREIAHLCRRAAALIVEGQKSLTVDAREVARHLGPVKFKREPLSAANEAGRASGLAWTAVGGEMLNVEAAVMDGTGKLELTGSLGDVMKESAKAAVTCLRVRADKLGISGTFYKDKDIHIHFPEGATPKDGPSAGITVASALLSALSGRQTRGECAMTGELTLLGKVLPVGGIREKTMAAYLNGIKTVVIPEENLPDLEQTEQTVRDSLRFVPVKTVDEVFDAVFADARDRARAEKAYRQEQKKDRDMDRDRDKDKDKDKDRDSILPAIPSGGGISITQ